MADEVRVATLDAQVLYLGEEVRTATLDTQVMYLGNEARTATLSVQVMYLDEADVPEWPSGGGGTLALGSFNTLREAFESLTTEQKDRATSGSWARRLSDALEVEEAVGTTSWYERLYSELGLTSETGSWQSRVQRELGQDE